MKSRLLIILSMIIISSFVPQTFGLSIDTYTTHNELNPVIAGGDSFVFTIEGEDLKRPLGITLSYEDNDDVLKVKITDPNGNQVKTAIIYTINEYQNSISVEFTPEYQGEYQVKIINMGESNVSLFIYYGKMLTWQEIDEIRKQNAGYFFEEYVPITIILLFLLIGGSVGFVIGYFLSKRKRK